MISDFSSRSSVPENKHLQIQFSSPVEIAPGITVVTVSAGDKSCHLVLSGGASLLINCLQGLEPADVVAAGYPLPEEIWHTQVDDTLAGEGSRFEAVIRLPHSYAEVAMASDAYWEKTRTTWDRPEDWMTTFGRETYGVAGSLILQPLSMPLARFETFEIGETISWRGCTFLVLDHSVRNFYSVGFALQQKARTLALFSGDLVDGSGRLPDAHGFESNYAGIPWQRIACTLHEAASIKPQWLFPANGEPVHEPATMLDELAARVEGFRELAESKSQMISRVAQQPAAFGRYFDHGHSVYQIANFGNVILLINPEGVGLMIDPGPCDYENPRRKEDFIADLEKFEAELGLKEIDLVLITHFHGDHYDLWPLVTDRYPSCKLAAWLPVADVIERPGTYPYPCLLPWYDVGWNECLVEVTTSRREPLLWRGTEIHTVHLPGHCFVHAGYWLDWNGRRILFSGDSIQTRGEVDGLQMPIANHSVPGTDEGHAQAYQNVLPLGITLNLGGHSSHFQNCTEIYRESLRNIEGISAHLLDLFAEKDQIEIFLRKSFEPSAERIRQLMRFS